jgi:hypothetical protein
MAAGVAGLSLGSARRLLAQTRDARSLPPAPRLPAQAPVARPPMTLEAMNASLPSPTQAAEYTAFMHAVKQDPVKYFETKFALTKVQHNAFSAQTPSARAELRQALEKAEANGATVSIVLNSPKAPQQGPNCGRLTWRGDKSLLVGVNQEFFDGTAAGGAPGPARGR